VPNSHNSLWENTFKEFCSQDLDYNPEERESHHELWRDGVASFVGMQKVFIVLTLLLKRTVKLQMSYPLCCYQHEVQNVLLLCLVCHDRFENLKLYVDVVDDGRMNRFLKAAISMGSSLIIGR
jgi:hypothetical protein